jgi:hypothetical protein
MAVISHPNQSKTGDGLVSRAELERSNEFMPAHIQTHAELEHFADVDVNTDGLLDKAELTAFMLRIHTLNSEIQTFAAHILSARGRWKHSPALFFVLTRAAFPVPCVDKDNSGGLDLQEWGETSEAHVIYNTLRAEL